MIIIFILYYESNQLSVYNWATCECIWFLVHDDIHASMYEEVKNSN